MMFILVNRLTINISFSWVPGLCARKFPDTIGQDEWIDSDHRLEYLHNGRLSRCLPETNPLFSTSRFRVLLELPWYYKSNQGFTVMNIHAIQYRHCFADTISWSYYLIPKRITFQHNGFHLPAKAVNHRAKAFSIAKQFVQLRTCVIAMYSTCWSSIVLSSMWILAVN